MSRETQEAEPPVAPLLNRAAASLLDAVIQIVIFLSVIQAVDDPNAEQATTVALVMVLSALYIIGTLVAFSATPGKLLMRIWVSDGTSGRIRPDQAILRHLVVAAGNLSVLGVAAQIFFIFVAVTSILMVLFDGKRRALHDRIAGTLVVAGRPPQPAEADEFGRRL